jgi:hypothetical protein
MPTRTKLHRNPKVAIATHIGKPHARMQIVRCTVAIWRLGRPLRPATTTKHLFPGGAFIHTDDVRLWFLLILVILGVSSNAAQLYELPQFHRIDRVGNSCIVAFSMSLVSSISCSHVIALERNQDAIPHIGAMYIGENTSFTGLRLPG